ncbi:hypothetical protein UFOVP130_44 [uncultured Caudovirales phage]|uniref:Uncharacterized protein n=1 Tax=uncultured Caudovirales phage TaxID=2100421 RepID=A0A6J5LBS0_9CAUD|nr:hypothetical protein UFOVP130_44 [uncultured Caudovirales phage]
MNFESRLTIPSTLTGFEDVKFTLNKMTEGRRIKLRLALAETSAKLREMVEEATTLAGQSEPSTVRASALLDGVTALIEEKVTPQWVRWGLHSIEGLTIDGEAATTDSLIESGPRALYAEIADAIKREAGMSEEQRGESAPPTISGAPVDGRTNGISADPVVN